MSDALKQYIEGLDDFPRVTPEEEKRLGAEAQAGDEDAVRALAEANLRFVIGVRTFP